MKNSSYTIGNRTRDLPACSTVPQPNALPRALLNFIYGPNVDECNSLEDYYIPPPPPPEGRSPKSLILSEAIIKFRHLQCFSFARTTEKD